MNTHATNDLCCKICMLLYDMPAMIQCGHSFCQSCITRYLRTNAVCPVCGADVADDDRTVPNHDLKQIVDEHRKRLDPGSHSASSSSDISAIMNNTSMKRNSRPRSSRRLQFADSPCAKSPSQRAAENTHPYAAPFSRNCTTRQSQRSTRRTPTRSYRTYSNVDSSADEETETSMCSTPRQGSPLHDQEGGIRSVPKLPCRGPLEEDVEMAAAETPHNQPHFKRSLLRRSLGALEMKMKRLRKRNDVYTIGNKEDAIASARVNTAFEGINENEETEFGLKQFPDFIVNKKQGGSTLPRDCLVEENCNEKDKKKSLWKRLFSKKSHSSKAAVHPVMANHVFCDVNTHDSFPHSVHHTPSNSSLRGSKLSLVSLFSRSANTDKPTMQPSTKRALRLCEYRGYQTTFVRHRRGDEVTVVVFGAAGVGRTALLDNLSLIEDGLRTLPGGFGDWNVSVLNCAERRALSTSDSDCDRSTVGYNNQFGSLASGMNSNLHVVTLLFEKTDRNGTRLQIVVDIIDGEQEEDFESEYSIAPYILAADGFILLYACDEPKSLLAAKTIHREINRQRPGMRLPSVLLGNQIDGRENHISTADAERTAKNDRMSFLEMNINHSIAQLVKVIRDIALEVVSSRRPYEVLL